MFVWCRHGNGFSFQGRLPGTADWSLWTNYAWVQCYCTRLFQCQYQFYFCIRLWFVGPNLFPIHSCEFDITKILCYQNYVSSIFTQLQLCHIYFWSGHRHDQTCQSTINMLVHYIMLCSDSQFFLFNIVMTTAPQWRIHNIFSFSLDLRPKMCIYVGKVVITTAFCIFSVVITADLHWRLLVVSCIFLMRW